MKKWLLRILYAALVLTPIGAIADYTATQGAGSTVFAFVCSTTKICPAMVLIDSTNVEKATASNPLRTDPVGTTTQPVSAASLPLPAGASTSAIQSNQLTQETATAAAAGTTADAVYTGTGNATLVAALKGVFAQQVLTESALTTGSNTDTPCTLPATTTACSLLAVQKAAANAILTPPTLGSASGGMSIKTLPGLTNTAGGTAVKASAGQVYRVQCYNPDASNSALIELFNTASVTLGTTTPFDFVEIGPGQNAGFTLSLVGEQFSSAITAAGVKTYNTATAPTTALDCTVAYN